MEAFMCVANENMFDEPRFTRKRIKRERSFDNMAGMEDDLVALGDLDWCGMGNCCDMIDVREDNCAILHKIKQDDDSFEQEPQFQDSSPEINEVAMPNSPPPNIHPTETTSSAPTAISILLEARKTLELVRVSLRETAASIQLMFSSKSSSNAAARSKIRHLEEVLQCNKKRLQENESFINCILQKIVLTPSELHEADSLKMEGEILRIQASLYEHEVDALNETAGGLTGAANSKGGHRKGKREKYAVHHPLAALFILNQPFPNVIRQHTQVTEEEMVVQLIVGATVKVTEPCKVTTKMIIEGSDNIPEKDAVENSEEYIDLSSLTVCFALKFVEGTRKSPASLKFCAEIQVVQCDKMCVKGTIESGLSKSFVIMTNQRQYEDCEKMLLIRDSFKESEKVSWATLANAIQRQFMRSTRQRMDSPNVRPISSWDFAYMKERYFRDSFSSPLPMITMKQYDQFWNWYGHCLQLLRYQRHIVQLWSEGLLYGFLNRDEVFTVLGKESPGTIIIRFSEQHLGHFAVAYVVKPGDVRHYLVKSNDTAGAKITLPDFLHSIPQWRSILRFTVDSSNTPRFQAVDKVEVLRKFFSNRRAEKDSTGYEEHVEMCFT